MVGCSSLDEGGRIAEENEPFCCVFLGTFQALEGSLDPEKGEKELDSTPGDGAAVFDESRGLENSEPEFVGALGWLVEEAAGG